MFDYTKRPRDFPAHALPPVQDRCWPERRARVGPPGGRDPDRWGAPVAGEEDPAEWLADDPPDDVLEDRSVVAADGAGTAADLSVPPGQWPADSELERLLDEAVDEIVERAYTAWAAEPDAGRPPAHTAAEVREILDRCAALTGLELAETLEAIDLDLLDEGDSVDAVAAWQRVMSWAQARRGQAAATLERGLVSTFGISNTTTSNRAGSSLPHASTELSMRLGVTRHAAGTIVRTGTLLDGPLLATGDALERGVIDQTKAQIIAKALDGLPYPVTCEVEEVVLPRAAGRTPNQLAQDVAEALIRTDPDGAVQRNGTARSKRRVTHPRVLPDGMASMVAVLPAEDAIALDLALEGAARTARAGGDRRTTDQLRADALAGVGIAALRTGWLGPAPQEQPPDRAVAPDAQPPATGMAVGQIGGKAARINVTVPISTLLGGGLPGTLEGYGAVDPATARAVALGGTWRRLVTDPANGTVLDLGRSRYRPPAGLADLVRARDRTCVRPGCTTAASACDLDHSIAFIHGGPTALWNLGAMCTPDHRVKTLGDFTVRQLDHGVFEWTSRSGHRYRREQDGATTYLGRTDPETGKELIPLARLDDSAAPPF